MKLLSWCERLIACRSLTYEGTREIAELCARELLAPAGIDARLIGSPFEGDRQVNLFARVNGRDSNLAPLVLNTHLDTVPPGDAALWTRCGGDPFAATVDGDRIYGLGAADTKLDFLAKVSALAAVGTPRRDVYLVGSFGEEHGLVGAREIAQSGLLPPGALAFVGEPSRLEVITAHKGLMAFELELQFGPVPLDPPLSASKAVFTGLSAHSSTPTLGANAIRAALEAIAGYSDDAIASLAGGDAVNKVPARCELVVTSRLASKLAQAAQVAPVGGTVRSLVPGRAIQLLLRFIRRLSEFADRSGPAEPGYAAPTLTCNPGLLRSDDRSITLQFELRPPPSMTLEAVRAGVYGIAAGLARETNEVRLSLAGKRANPGFRSPDASEAVELALASLADAGLPLRTAVKTGCTEAGIYAAAGLVPVVFGPGPSVGVIHAPHEYNLMSEVEGAIRFYRALLAR